MSVTKSIARAAALAALTLVAGTQAQAASLSQGFDNVANLPGWSLVNNSSPVGTTDWFQGDDGIFPAFSGADSSYIAANFNNTGATGTISNWLITPTLSFNNGDVVSFYTRTEPNSAFPDRLEVRFSNVGGADVGTTATSVGTFTQLLLSINPTLAVGGNPEGWTPYSATISGLSGATNGAIAFRYFVTDAGVSADNANYIGIDDVAIAPSDAAAVPEPGAWLMMVAGFGAVGVQRRRDMRRRSGQVVQWRTRQDSNLWPLPSEGSALSS